MSGRRDRHVHAIASGIQRQLKESHSVAPLSVEGQTASQWVLIDFNDVVVHVFQEDARCFYDLEGLWIDAERMVIPDPPDRRAVD
jgi:ribosome-associated protein